MAPKIYVIGSVNGHLDQFSQRLETVHTKQVARDGQGPAICIVTGDLFSKHDPTLTDIDFPIPVYFSTGSNGLPNSIADTIKRSDTGEVAHNLTHLRSGEILTTSDGIRIGVYNPPLSKEASAPPVKTEDTTTPVKTEDTAFPIEVEDTASPFKVEDIASPIKAEDIASPIKAEDRDLTSLLSACPPSKALDILLTPTSWPQSINGVAPSPVPQSDSTATIAKLTRPRYHLGASSPDEHFSKQIYYRTGNGSEPRYRICWFYSFASLGNAKKAKHEYLFMYDPSQADATEPPAGAEQAPRNVRKRPLDTPAAPKVYESTYDRKRGGRTPKRQRRADPNEGDNCYLCLGNEGVKEHLVVDVGNTCYMTIARGPLTPPHHYLVMPIDHISTPLAIADSTTRATTISELHIYRTALSTMIKTAMPTHTAISYTLTRPGLPHLLYQILAIPTTHITSGAVEAAFHAEAASWGVAITSETYDGQDEDEGFRVWIPEGEGEKKLSIRLQPGDMFPAQFGRMVLAKVLEVPLRERWQNCVEVDEVEKGVAQKASEGFTRFRPEGL